MQDPKGVLEKLRLDDIKWYREHGKERFILNGGMHSKAFSRRIPRIGYLLAHPSKAKGTPDCQILAKEKV